MILCLMQFTTGCGIFGGGKTYDGSQNFSESMPQYNNPPPYMDPEPQPMDGK
jgi:hypothetical protein